MDKQDYEILGPIWNIETFASGRGIRDLPRLQKCYGSGFWRKCKGIARVRFPDGAECIAEVHWYEATGIGPRDVKIKQVLR